MYCKKCNSQINKNDKYCSTCGAKITKKENGKPSRKLLKEIAKSKNKKSLIITTIIFMLTSIIIAITYKTIKIAHMNELTALLTFIITLIIVGLLISIYIFDMYGGAIKISQNINLNTKQILTKFTKRPKNSISLILLMLGTITIITTTVILILLKDFLNVLMPAFVVISIIIAIYIIPIFKMLLFILADEKNKNKKLSKCIKEAINLPKNKRIQYYGLELSFISWHILSILTLGILYIWVYPYIVLSEANLYKTWTQETEFLSTKKEISNPKIIFITVIIIFFILIGIHIIFTKFELLSTNEYATLELDKQKVTFKIPKNCALNQTNHTIDYVEYNCNNKNEDIISYALSYHFADDFKTAKQSTKKQYEKKVYNVTLNDYTTKINGKETKVFYIDYKLTKNSKKTYRDTYVFYRLSKDIDAKIILSINNVNKKNLKNYIVIK